MPNTRMTRNQHADEAEKLLERAKDPDSVTNDIRKAVGALRAEAIGWQVRASLTNTLVAIAQVHATLAAIPYPHCCDAGED